MAQPSLDSPADGNPLRPHGGAGRSLICCPWTFLASNRIRSWYLLALFRLARSETAGSATTNSKVGNLDDSPAAMIPGLVTATKERSGGHGGALPRLSAVRQNGCTTKKSWRLASSR